MDRVLEQRSTPGASGIRPPRRRVLALDWQELVVGEVDRHHVARSLVPEKVANHHVAGQEPEDQPDLVDDAGLFDVSDHLLDDGASTASGFSQNTARPAAAASATRRGCSDVHVQTKTTSASSTSVGLADAAAPVCSAKLAARAASGS